MFSIKAILGLLLMWVAIMVGSIATYSNLKNTRGPKEHAFVLRVSIASWLIILSMLILVYYIPSPFRWWVFVGYFVVCPILIYNWSTTHQLIRLIEEREEEDKKATPTAT